MNMYSEVFNEIWNPIPLTYLELLKSCTLPLVKPQQAEFITSYPTVIIGYIMEM